MWRSGTTNSGSWAPGMVQPEKATPNVRVASFAARPTRSTSSMSAPAAAAAPSALKTTKSPAMPRRSSRSGDDATSSVTSTMRVSMPSWRSRSAAMPKFITSPA